MIDGTSRKERPLCRRAIETFGLRLDVTRRFAVDRDGRRRFVSAGILTQLRKQEQEAGDQ